MVGGAPITQRWAERIGADAFLARKQTMLLRRPYVWSAQNRSNVLFFDRVLWTLRYGS
jgi:hypothetical protein